MGNWKKRAAVLLAGVLALAACTPGETPPATDLPAAATTATPAITAGPTNTPISLAALRASPAATQTALPTATPPPTLAPTRRSIVPTVVDLGIVATAIPSATYTPPPSNTPVPPVITRFTTDAIGVDALDLALGREDVPLAWRVDNRAPGTNLVFEQVFPDGRTFNVERPRHFVEVPSEGSGSVIPILPGGDAAEIRLQLRVVAMSTGATLARAELRIPVNRLPDSGFTTASGDACYQAPYIPSTGVQIGARGIVSQQLAAGLPLTAISGVGGRVVANLPRGETFVVLEGPFCYRAPGSNEGHRQWRVRVERSGLEGWVHEYSGTFTEYRLYFGVFRGYRVYDPAQCYSAPFLPDRGIRVGFGARLSETMQYGLSVMQDTVDRPGGSQTTGSLQAGETFTVIDGPYCLRIEPATQETLGHRQWKVRSEVSGVSGWVYEYSDERLSYIVPAGEAPGGLVINAFDVQPRTVAAGGQLTLTWDVSGVNGVSLWMWHEALPARRVSLSGTGALLPLAGSLTISAPTEVTSARFTIFGQEGTGADGIPVTITCAYPWFAAGERQTFCPNAPARMAQAAYQPFERGLMVWFEGRIWWLDNGGNGRIEPDRWAGGDVVYDETPPAGLYQPVRGFGTLWVADSSVRSALGWATAPEQGYTLQVQETNDFARPGQRGSYYASEVVLTLPDGRALSLTRVGSSIQRR